MERHAQVLSWFSIIYLIRVNANSQKTNYFISKRSLDTQSRQAHNNYLIDNTLMSEVRTLRYQYLFEAKPRTDGDINYVHMYYTDT